MNKLSMAKGNSARARERAKIWYENNKDRVNEERRIAYQLNKTEHAAKIKTLRDRDPDDWKKRYKSYSRKYKYGISEEQFQDLVIRHNSCCAICGLKDDSLHIDHNHGTGEIRGLLCGHCNKGLGLFRDNAIFLRNAANYLEQSPPELLEPVKKPLNKVTSITWKNALTLIQENMKCDQQKAEQEIGLVRRGGVFVLQSGSTLSVRHSNQKRQFVYLTENIDPIIPPTGIPPSL